MKKIMLACLFVLICTSLALADWVDNFKADYVSSTIEQAVINAMKEGVAPALIFQEGLKLQGVSPVKLIQSLYCAGAPGAEIEQAVKDNGISELVLATGYKKSIAECKGGSADTQAYTPPTPPPITPVFAGPIGRGGTVYYASPSAF